MGARRLLLSSEPSQRESGVLRYGAERRIVTRSVVCAAACTLVVSCTTGTEPARSAQGYQAGQPGTQGYAAPAAPPQQPGQPNAASSAAPAPAGQAGVPPLGSILGDSTTLENIVAGALAGGAATLGALTGGELAALEQGVKLRAETDAKGMKPAGQLMSARLQKDGHAQAQFSLEAGRCYTIVGFGGPGVFQYQINLLTTPPLAPQVLAQSGADAPHPTVGANSQCIRNPYPLPMLVQVDMHVLRGQGMVCAQAYRK
jgi:hypothetical protein